MICYTYATYSTYAKAEAALEDMFATGDVTASEFHDIRRINKRWHILLRAS
jgi:hypothetical protein